MDSRTALYGVIGNPIRHSLSPKIHNAAFQKLSINAAYLAFQVDKEFLGLAFEAMRALQIKGLNITLPHKEDAINFVDEVPTDLDRCIGAINTVVNRDGRLLGYNTDVPGFLGALREELQFNPETKSILVLGAGGAARGVVFALAHAGADKIYIFNRTIERAHGLQGYLKTHFPETEVKILHSPEHAKDEKIHLLVNATSCGMRAEDPAAFDLQFLKKEAAVYDLVYSPTETLLLKKAREQGRRHANGLGMLAGQAAISFGLWTGQKEGVRQIMLEALRQ
ncbi:MAG: shikimate dehydrogenase [Candidatus Omnitrophica bacterium]|nr:shikimate dehydrogenase [Candidatus Omnitrophota bacterium]